MVDGDYLIIKWHVDDIIERAKETGKNVSIVDARIILQNMDKYHDCNIGITWETVDFWIDSFTQEKSK